MSCRLMRLSSRCSERDFFIHPCRSISHSMFINLSQFAVIAVIMAASIGCGTSGPRIAPVEGRVTLDGEPLARADITFQPEGAQRASIARTDDNGRFELAYKRGEPGAIVGKHTVHIEVSSEVVKNPPPIPARYAEKSELSYQVESGSNEINIDLKSDPK